MTAGEPRPQEHCGHECVCSYYHSENECPCSGIRRAMFNTGTLECEHDTRHSSSPAPVPDDMTRALTEAYHEGWADREKMGDLPKAEQGFKCRMRVKAEDDIRQQAAEAARREVLDEVVKMSMMIEQNETERWESCGRPKNDGYINGSHSGFGHALRELRHMIDMVKKADSVRSGEEVQR